MNSSARVPVHVFIDVSRCAHDAAVGEIEWLQRPDALGGLVERATVATRKPLDLPKGWTGAQEPATRVCERAFINAAGHGAHLLVVFDGARPTSDAIGSLAGTLAIDPLFGLAHPRFADADGRRVTPPMTTGDASQSGVARDVLALVAAFYLTTEYLSPCFLIRRELVANLAPRLEGWTDVKGLLTEYAVRARRIGFRTVVSNRVVVRLDPCPAGSAELRPDNADLAVVKSAFPEVDRARCHFSRLAAFEQEQLVSQFFDGPYQWLLDGRNLIASVNGTVKAALGICDGLFATRPGPQTTLWVSAAAADYHRLEHRYAGWRVIRKTPADRFGAAFRLSQPWQLTEALDLHALAPVNVFLMNDTIAWDVVYPAMPGLEATWTYVATHADGVLFISEFSRQRFLARFALSPSVRTAVVHHSLDPADYVTRSARTASPEPYWLIVGNPYDHKYVKPTLDLMTRSFPRKRLIAFGDRGPTRGPYVTQLESGPIEESQMQGLYSNAEIVVFPSFYEGFGLPLVNALAYGSTVVARDSALVREIGGAYQGPGRLVVYENETDLIDHLSRLAHSRPVPEVALARDGQHLPFGWAQAGRDIEAFIDGLVRDMSLNHTRARTALISMLRTRA